MAQKIMVEVSNAAELEEALPTHPDFILLDNMARRSGGPMDMKQRHATRVRDGRPLRA